MNNVEFCFSLYCTLFIIGRPEQEIEKKKNEKSYVELKQEVDNYIDQMQKPEAKFNFEMIKDSLVSILAMLNMDKTAISSRMKDCKSALYLLSEIMIELVTDESAITEEFKDFTQLVEHSYRDGNHFDAYNYFLCYSSACHENWFKEKKEDANTAYRQMLLAGLVVKMIELSNINATADIDTVSLPENHMFSFFSLMGFFALKYNWKDKVKCVTSNPQFISAIIDKYRDDFAKRYMSTAAGSSGKLKEIKPNDVEKPEITSNGQLDKLNGYLKILLEMLLCTSMSQEERLEILTGNVGLLSGVRAYYEKRFPKEYKEAFDKCLDTSDKMQQAYSEGGVWKAGEIMEEVCLDRYRKWKIRAAAMDAQIGAIWQMLLLVLLLGLLAEIGNHDEARAQVKSIFVKSQAN
ncbi:hypothetical protein Ciccas_011650 [Cichlidogyrus casuarinus]|uniref:Uncharacterized protein n=1 Tax=Cichlidogyrus casuarinus TaxID=1844966 RepID=A0ABD2PR33_9PLAT